MLNTLFQQLENFRVRNHLRLTEKYLRAQDTSHLTDSLKTKRAKLLDALHRYWTAGIFPKNTHHHYQRESYFVDSWGTPCAMGYLMLVDGQDTLVNQIKKTANYIHLADVGEGKIVNWIDSVGFTQEEASRVQPTYGPCWPNGCPPPPLILTLLPWIAGAASFIILEILSYQLLGNPLEHTKMKRVAGLTYLTLVNVVLSLIVGVVVYSFRYNLFGTVY